MQHSSRNRRHHEDIITIVYFYFNDLCLNLFYYYKKAVFKINSHVIKKGFERIDAFIKIIENITMYIASICLIVMTSLITVDSIFRYFLNKPIIGVLEVTENILMVGIVYLGLSYTSRGDGHIRVDIFSRKFPKKLQRINMFIFNIVAVVFFSIIGYQAWLQTVNAIQINQLSSGAVEFPMAPAYFLVVLGAILLSVRLFMEAIKQLFKENEVKLED